MENGYFVIIEYTNSSMVLGLEAQTFENAKRSIAWQRRGDVKEPMFICTYDAPNRVFVSVDSKDKTFFQEAGKRFNPGRAPYTEKAWNDFAFGLQVERPGSPEFHFFRSYIGTALWSTNDESDESGGVPLDRNHDISDIDDDTLKAMQADCAAFYEANSEHIHCDGAPLSNEDMNIAAREAAMAGHDFWLTRCGHGAGFWDGDWPEPAATALDKACEEFANVDLYVGDDGKIYA